MDLAIASEDRPADLAVASEPSFVPRPCCRAPLGQPQPGAPRRRQPARPASITRSTSSSHARPAILNPEQLVVAPILNPSASPSPARPPSSSRSTSSSPARPAILNPSSSQLRPASVDSLSLHRDPPPPGAQPLMTGSKGAHGASLFIRHRQMNRALGIKSSSRIRPMRGRDRRPGTWWDCKLNRIAIEGQDFAQDTQEGGADQFVLIPDSDEEGAAKGSSLIGDDDEYVPETEPQDVVTISRGPWYYQGPKRFGQMLHDWKRIISDAEKESAKVEMDCDKLEKESDKVQMDNNKLEKESGKVQMDSNKLEKESDKVQMESNKLERESAKEELDHVANFSDLETDDEAWWLQDSVDLRGYSQVEDDEFNDQVLLTIFVIRVR